MEKRFIKLSKFLSLVLRHQPQKIGLSLDEGGWASIAELLHCARKAHVPLDLETLLEIVDQNDKKRFAISEDDQKIRANQGHTISVDLGLEPARPPEQLYHGTSSRFIGSIKLHGLRREKRHHVHLSPDHQTAFQVGKRHGQPVVLTILAGRMHQGGYLFYLSKNGVWLVSEVPPQYILFP